MYLVLRKLSMQRRFGKPDATDVQRAVGKPTEDAGLRVGKPRGTEGLQRAIGEPIEVNAVQRAVGKPMK
jgi:hypothetical protein